MEMAKKNKNCIHPPVGIEKSWRKAFRNDRGNDPCEFFCAAEEGGRSMKHRATVVPACRFTRVCLFLFSFSFSQ